MPDMQTWPQMWTFICAKALKSLHLVTYEA
jgi:hypothetical protein